MADSLLLTSGRVTAPEGSRPHRLLIGFFVRFALLYILLIIPWPPIENAYAGAYRYVLNGVARDLDLERGIWLRPNPRVSPANDSQIVRASGMRARTFPHSSRYPAYASTAFLIALTLATPVRWSRRLTSLLWGLLILNQLLALRMVVTFLILDDPGPALLDESFTKRFLFASKAGEASGSLWYVIATAIWALLMFRSVFREALAPAGEPAPTEVT
jgi:hypothetical protein